MENGPFTGDVPIKTSIHRGFSIAMFDYRRVLDFMTKSPSLDNPPVIDQLLMLKTILQKLIEFLSQARRIRHGAAESLAQPMQALLAHFQKLPSYLHHPIFSGNELRGVLRRLTVNKNSSI